MILQFSLISLLINNIICNTNFDKLYAFDAAVKQTKDFFMTMKIDYASKNLNEHIVTEVEDKILKHIGNVSKIMVTRRKRELQADYNTEISVFDGLKNYKELNFDRVQDINFFSLEYGQEIVWYTVVLYTSEVILYQMKNGLYYGIGSYPLISGKRIIVHGSNYGALLIIQNEIGSVLILRFNRIMNKYYFQPIQDFELNDITHLVIWNGMNQLHLCIASDSNISIFVWFGNYFDLMQVIDIGTKKVIAFQSKGFMYLAVTGSNTLIFKYFLKFNKYLIIQRLPYSQDISSFHIKEGHFMENFLILSNEVSTIIYKEVCNRFVPFQQIYSGKLLVPITLNRLIVLLIMHEDAIAAYQYDGWGFVQLYIKLFDINTVQQVTFYEKQMLLMKYKNYKWVLTQPVLAKIKSYKDFLEDVKIWNLNIKKMVQKTINKDIYLATPITMLKSYIGNLYVHSINEHNSNKLKNITKHYNELAIKITKQKSILKTRGYSKKLVATSLYAKKVTIKCKPKCRINKLKLKNNINILSITDIMLTTKQIKNWKCPYLSVPVENIIIDNSINGMPLQYLKQNTLQVSGNQKITGDHSFVSLNATNSSMPLDIAVYITNQEMKIKNVKVTKLNLTDGGILLPLNGLPTTVTGSIKVPILRAQNIIRLKGKIIGKWMKILSPMIFMSELMVLDGDLDLENVKIENLKSGDLIINEFGSVKTIVSNAISLNDNVPTSLILSSDSMKWRNVSLRSLPKWITTNSLVNTNITGKKHVLHNIEVNRFSYNKLKLPQIKSSLCATSIIAPDIKSLLLTADNISIQNLMVFKAFGHSAQKYCTNDTLFSPKWIKMCEQYYHNVIAQKVFVTHINNINLTELETLGNLWIEPNIFNTSIIAIKIITNNFQSPIRFKLELSDILSNIMLEQNAEVDIVNDINIKNLLLNAIKLDDMISLQNVTFNHGFRINQMHTTHFSLPFTKRNGTLNLHNKKVSRHLETNNIYMPYTFEIIEYKAPVNIFIKGFVSSSAEPIIQNINNIRFKELLTSIWVATNSTIFYGKNLHIEEMLIMGNITLNNSMGTLNPETWKNISKHVLSKTKCQEIKVRVSMNDTVVSIITSNNTSDIKYKTNFHGMFDGTLMKKKYQVVKAKWTFNSLQVLGYLDLERWINKVDLNKHVISHDFWENIVTGKKRISVLTTRNLNSLLFYKWANKAFLQGATNAIIMGHNSFNSITFKNIKVSGTMMGYTMENILSISTNQNIYNKKVIQNFIHGTDLVLQGLLNDVNLTTLMEHQLKKYKPQQNILSAIELQHNLNIYGDLTVYSSYARMQMKNLQKNYPTLVPVSERMTKAFKVVETIGTVLQNRAVYINKLEMVKHARDFCIKCTPVQMQQCDGNNILQECNNERIINFGLGENSTNFILLKTIRLNQDEYVVFIKLNTVSLYLYDNINNNLVRLKELYVPRIMNALAESILHSLWIVLRLPSQTLALHYQPWDMQEHILPPTNVFTLYRSPNDQLLLLLSDGVWILDGLASPRNIIGIPLKEKLEILVDDVDYYMRYNDTSLMKARYIGS